MNRWKQYVSLAVLTAFLLTALLPAAAMAQESSKAPVDEQDAAQIENVVRSGEDKTALLAEIEALLAICNSRNGDPVWDSEDGTDVSRNALWVPTGTRSALTYDVLKPARRVAEDENATQTEIDAATEMVAGAIAAYEKTIRPGTAASDIALTANGSPESGSTIEICLTMALGGRYEGLSAMISTTGLTYQSNSMSPLSTEKNAILIGMLSTRLTYKYLVSASAGQSVQFDLTNVELQTPAGDNITGEPFSWRAKVSSGGSSAVPPASIPAVPGYQAGYANGRLYYAKTSAAAAKYYLRSGSGKMTRVAAPGVKASGQTFYPVSIGGNVLFPRVENGKVTCYCTYQDGKEIPVLNAAAVPPALASGYQTGKVNGRTYYVKISGAGMKFYLKSSSGKMTRVAAPGVADANGARYYPINHGGTALFPQLVNGRISAYTTGSGTAVLTAA